MKYKVIGWSIIFIVIIGAYFIIVPREDDIIRYKYKIENVEKIVIRQTEDTTLIVVEDYDVKRMILDQLLKCKKVTISPYPKGGFFSIDLVLYLKDGSQKEFRLCDYVCWENEERSMRSYIQGHSYEYRNDSLNLLVKKIAREN